MKKTVKFQDVAFGAEFKYNGKNYCRVSRAKARELADNWMQSIMAHALVEIEVAEKPATVVRSWKDEPASEKQMDYLDRLGIAYDRRAITKGRASELIDAHKDGILGSHYGFYSDGSN
jgi:hypothetical protein